jgi:hypothetical protein
MDFLQVHKSVNCHKCLSSGSEQPQEVSEMPKVNTCGGHLAQHVGNVCCVTHRGYRKQTEPFVQKDRITPHFNHKVLNAMPQSVNWQKQTNNLASKKSRSYITNLSHMMYI